MTAAQMAEAAAAQAAKSMDASHAAQGETKKGKEADYEAAVEAHVNFFNWFSEYSKELVLAWYSNFKYSEGSLQPQKRKRNITTMKRFPSG